MSVPSPHFRLRCEGQPRQGRWRFVLEDSAGAVALDAADREAYASPERLELLAVVRGLEALDQPSEVTLAVSSRYVLSGLRWGLDEWRANGWTWERFGQMVPIKHRDLWQRLDRAMQFHHWQVETMASAPPPAIRSAGRQWRFDAPHEPARPPQAAGTSLPRPQGGVRGAVCSLGRRLSGALRSASAQRERSQYSAA